MTKPPKMGTMIIMVAYAFVPAGIIAFVVDERNEKANSKHQQLLCGARLPTYWLANFAFDLGNYVGGGLLWHALSPEYWRGILRDVRTHKPTDPALYSKLVQHLFMLIPGPFFWACVLMQTFDFSAYVDNGAYPAVCTLFFAYGWAIIPFCYVLSNFFVESTQAQIYSVLLGVFTGLVLLIATFIMSLIESTRDVNDGLMYLYYFLPPFALGRGLFQIGTGRTVDIFFRDENYMCECKGGTYNFDYWRNKTHIIEPCTGASNSSLIMQDCAKPFGAWYGNKCTKHQQSECIMSRENGAPTWTLTTSAV